ncbi:hypothetical protein RUND412_008448 [Rhizina undulata]
MSFSYNNSDDNMLFGQNKYHSHHDQDAYNYGSDELPVASSDTSNSQTIDPRLLTVGQNAIYSQYQGAEYNPAVERFHLRPNPSNIHMLVAQNGLYSSQYHNEYTYNYGAGSYQVPVSSNHMLPIVDHSEITSHSSADNFGQYDEDYEEGLDKRLGPLFDFLTDEDAPGSPDAEFEIQIAENGYEPEGSGQFITSESLLQFGEEESDINAHSAVAPADPHTNSNVVKQNRTRIRKPRARACKEKITRTPRAVARSLNKAAAGINAGENAPDRNYSNCGKTQPAREFGCASRYQRVCRTCREKRAVLGDSRSYFMVCQKFKDIEEFTLGLLLNKNGYPRSCDIFRKRDSEGKEKETSETRNCCSYWCS